MSDEWGDSTSTSTIGNGTSSGDTGGDSWAASSTGGNGDSGGGSWGASGGASFGGDGNSESWGGGGSSENNSSSGGGHRGKGCFKCGEEGHMSRECPNGGSGGGGSRPQGKGCFKCGEEGHMSRECPNPGSSGGGGSRPRGCFKCGEEGHMSRECPNQGSGDSRPQGRGCFKCGEEGHMSRECPNPGNNDRNGGRFGQRRGGDDQGSSGGGSWDASSSSDRKPSSGGGSWGPSGGGEEGSEFSENSSRPQGKGCFKCGDESHQARDCSEPALDADGKPRPPIYINPDASEDTSLFDKVTTGVNFDRYEGLPCAVTGVDKPENPEKFETFEEAISSETIRAGLEVTGILKPMPIQKYGMRIVMAGRDLMACAQTGSGKTLAFMLPILQDLFSDPSTTSGYGKTPQEPRAVIVTPTRELALQIYKEAYKYSRDSIVKVQIIYGGTSVGHQKAKLSEGCHVLVGTPGRILDFLAKGVFTFSNLKYFVLDEADRMIDQGFIPEIRKMASHATMPSVEDRQTLMFSATFPDAVQRVAAEFLKKSYLFLAVGILGAANSDVEQIFFRVEKNEKRNKIMEVLGAKENNDRTMVFVEAKKTADFLASFLSQKGYKATSIHGDRFQHQREEALRDLKSGKYPILVATSVASRGLDIQGVLHVINYDLPKDIDDYVHRIGRTGRVGNKGRATSFYDPSFDRPLAEKIVPIIEKASQSVPEWLKTEAGEHTGSAGSEDAFGGVDSRNLNVSESTNAASKDDNWD